jgi:hypothetical protein
MKTVTRMTPSTEDLQDLEFAAILVKHTKSNAIVLAKGRQLLASGTGQTSRVDALEQAIAKAGKFNFDLHGAVMASDAFFPFPDCVRSRPTPVSRHRTTRWQHPRPRQHRLLRPARDGHVHHRQQSLQTLTFAHELVLRTSSPKRSPSTSVPRTR